MIKEGEEDDSLFVLLKGSVKVFAMDQEGREITYEKNQAGDYFGEMLLDGGPRSASVSTPEPCTCAVLVRSQVSEHLAVEPGFAINWWYRSFAGRVRPPRLPETWLCLTFTVGW